MKRRVKLDYKSVDVATSQKTKDRHRSGRNPLSPRIRQAKSIGWLAKHSARVEIHRNPLRHESSLIPSHSPNTHTLVEAGRQRLHRWKSVSWQNAFETTIWLLLDRTVVTISRQRSAGDGPMPMWLERVLQVYRRFVDGRSNSYLNFQAGEIRDTNLFEKLNLNQQSIVGIISV